MSHGQNVTLPSDCQEVHVASVRSHSFVPSYSPNRTSSAHESSPPPRLVQLPSMVWL